MPKNPAEEPLELPPPSFRIVDAEEDTDDETTDFVIEGQPDEDESESRGVVIPV